MALVLRPRILTPQPLAILLVDDDADSLDLMTGALAASGYEAETAASVADALAAIATRTFDLVVADVQMPAAGGFELLGQLRRRAPTTDVVLITASGSITDAVTATRAKAIYLTKGFAYQELVVAVREVAERRAIERELDPGSAKPALLVGKCPAIVQLKRNLRLIAGADGAVVICGESGTGKELVARMIHEASPRHGGPLVTVNCAAFPDTLIEAELFGHERGAFTGAATRREGRFEAAAGGTLFLDEIAEMPLASQAKLLRVLQEGTFQRLGSNATLKADVRIVSATNKDLEQRVAEGKFREDLFYRIKLFRLVMPPLRMRRDDLPLLVRHFCKKHSPAGAPHQAISAEAWTVLREHPFPGNVRELEHAIQHALAFARGEEIQVEHLPEDLAGELRDEPAPVPAADAPQALGAVRPLLWALTEFEHDYLLEVLERTEGNRSQAAALLGISRKALWAKLKRYPASSKRQALA